MNEQQKNYLCNLRTDGPKLSDDPRTIALQLCASLSRVHHVADLVPVVLLALKRLGFTQAELAGLWDEDGLVSSWFGLQDIVTLAGSRLDEE